MEKELIGKEVTVLVSFAGNFNGSSLAPVYFKGKLLGSDDLFLKLDCSKTKLAVDHHLNISFSKDEESIILLKKDYVIYIKEL